MKKLLTMALALVMLFALTACGNTKSSESGSKAPTNGATEAGTDGAAEGQTPDGETKASDGETKAPSSENGIDMSKYPEDINDWSAQNLVDYFADAGVFTNKDWTWVQDHATYWSDLPIYECSGYMDDEGMITIMCFTFKEELPDCSAEDIKAFMEGIKTDEKHMFPQYGDLIPMAVDHMIGNVAFSYEYTADEDVYNAMDAAYKQLVEALGVTPDF